MVRIVVTGGAGFIGSNLVLALLEAGDEVLVIDDLSVGHADNVDARAVLVESDILDSKATDELEAFAPDVVVHLAAQSSVVASIRDPERDRLVNVEGTRAIARAARRAGARLVLSASSAAVYGDPAELPLAETSLKSPINPYGASKLAAETALAEELAATGTDFASLRFSNVYGPRQDAAGEGGVVAQFMSAVSEGRVPVLFGDGEQTRDFIFVGDVVAAIVAAISASGRLASAGPAFNISTGRASSVNDLLGEVASAAGTNVRPERLEAREGDIKDSVLDPRLAESVLGWRAGTDLRTGIALTWTWWKSPA